jgi:histone deacetylase 11
VYSRRYNIGLPGLQRLHPFDVRKYGRAYHLLKQRLGHKFTDAVIAPPRPVGRRDLLAIHTAAYLDQLREPAYLARALEVPLLSRIPAWVTDWLVLRHMRWATMGTIVAARQALKCGLAINLSGGYHHAGPSRGEGFSIYNDIALAVRELRSSGALSDQDRVVYVDLDVHQGNGVCHAFFDDNRIYIFDMFNPSIYPASDAKAKRRVDCPVPMFRGCADADYLAALGSKLPVFLDGVSRSGHVGVAIYNAGTDIFIADALGGLNVSADGVLHRDRFVLDQLVQRQIPTVMLPSGGYSRESYKLVANTVTHVLEKWGSHC